MPIDPLVRESLKALALGNTGKVRELSQQLDRSHKQDQFVLTTALCGELLGFHLGDEASLDEIAAFVEEARNDYRDADPPVDLLAIEASIRAVYGEDHLLDDISGDQQLQAQFQIIGKIVHQSESAKRNLDRLLNQAEELAVEWSQEDG